MDAPRTVEDLRMGRPPKPARLKRKERLVVLMTEDELAEFDAWLAKNERERGECVRSLIKAAIEVEDQ